MPDVFDLPNILDVQKNLILNLGDDDLVAMNELAKKADALNTAISNSNTSILPTLTKQNDVQVVLDRETARLEERKQAIDTASVGQQRLIDLTRSATQRSRAINNIYIVGVVGLLLYLAIRFASGLLPEMVTDILTILVVSITLLMILKMYADLQRRNNMDFDTISLGEPSKMVGRSGSSASGSGSGSSSAGAGAGLIDSRIGGGCVKEACCPEGTKYNEKYAICVATEVPFSAVAAGKTKDDYAYFIKDKRWQLISTTDGCSSKNKYSFDELACKAPETFTTARTSDMAKPNDPFEFADYNLYK